MLRDLTTSCSILWVENLIFWKVKSPSSSSKPGRGEVEDNNDRFIRVPLSEILLQANILSRYTVVCRAAQETRGTRQTSVYFTGVKKTLFSRICSSTLPEQKHTKFFVWIPSGCGTSNSKFELNQPSCSRDMRLKSSSYFLRIFLFATLFKITITHACLNGLPWNLEHY